MKESALRLIAAASAAMMTTALAATPAQAESSNTDSIDWGSCPGPEDETVECATINVPLDYTAPRGQTIEIGLARRQAADPSRRMGSILMDPGGPGGSGVASVRQVNPLPPAVAERFDIVGFDPRGVNTSSRVDCGADALGAVVAIGVPTSPEEFEQLEAANADLAAECRKRTGPLFDHVDNQHTVEDMERIRRALGDGKLNYLGYSYGTLMGQQYAETYPHQIRTMVLDGNMDHSLRSTYDFMATETAPVEENFLAFAEWCEGAPRCTLHGDDVAEVYADLKAAARAGELTDPYTGAPLDFYELTVRIFDVNFPQSWPGLAERLAALRDGEPLDGASPLPEDATVEYPYYPMWCQDWGFDIADYDEFEALTGKLAEQYPNVEWTPYIENAIACIGSGIEHANPRGEVDADQAPPLVLIGNRHDFATVYEWTRSAAEQTGGHLVTYEGYWHTIYGHGYSQCVDEAVNAYFLERTIPAEGLSCPNLDFPNFGRSPSEPPRRLPGMVGPY
ncbi:alpha/beta hydrolase [Glycomyces xiaoerkulensis]|uniref:alpha/beta hydrolase n=1 Tax=Glycomyces xiaoerkulensis TaxID=2038139 RepID=UPI001E3E345B|nr:alpha/beta hydrolase [Glycomyces xiaoerkulensis]